MIKKISIRREDKNPWEARVPLTPKAVSQLTRNGIEVCIQSSSIRCYFDEDFVQTGAEIREEMGDSDLVIGIKEIPAKLIQPGKAYLFFSHTIKGQDYNMPLLQTFLDKKATLFDYERIVDEKGLRLIAFGNFAGLAGAVDTLAILGKRWSHTPLREIRFAHEYDNLAQAKQEIEVVGSRLRFEALPNKSLSFVIPGYGNVSQGVQEILRLLPLQWIEAREMFDSREGGVCAVLKEEDIVRPENGRNFDLADYYSKPEHYSSRFEDYLPYCNAIFNSIYWEARYPRLVTKKALKNLWSQSQNQKLQVIADISCDVGGSIECTLKVTNSGSPCFVYDPLSEQATDGWSGSGVAVMAVDNLPAEFAKDSSEVFSNHLLPLLESMLKVNFQGELDHCELPPSLRRSVIVWQGKLTPEYRYLEKYLVAC